MGRVFEKMRLRSFCRNHPNDKQCKVMLGDSDVFDYVFEHLHDEYTRAQEGHAGKLTDFLTWLMANKDGILALIATLVALFPK